GSDTGLSFGNGDGTLRTTGTTPAAAVYLSTGPGAVAADFDGDGKLDVLAGSTLLLSAAATVTPPPPTPDFAISASASSGSIAAGQSATATLTLTPSGGFSGTVSLSCSGAPSGATCSLSPASVALNGAATTTTLTLDTTARSAALTVPPSLRLDIGSNPTALLWALLGPVWLMRRPMRRAALHRARWLSLLILSAGFLCGCGGGGSSGGSSTGPVTPPASGTPAGTYTITVTASSGSLSHAQTYTLTVT
ncbi:MAG: VCBS repeat-containing protein, partial [Proteobacteria bacterium]|nr:VCBS repeat-containing protein [Pseudomonadota bacterium]